MDILDSKLRALEPLAAKVAQVHGAHNPKLLDVQRVFCEVRDLLRSKQDAGAALGHLRVLADGYVAPDWACRSYRALLAGLEDLERDVMRAA